MNKEQKKQFDRMGVKCGLYNACVEVDDIKNFISKLLKAEYKRGIKDGYAECKNRVKNKQLF